MNRANIRAVIVTVSDTAAAGGRVDVSIFADGAALQVRVRDDGVGLPAEWSFERDAGVGLKNVADRLEHIYGTPNLLQLVRVPTGGAEVQIVLPGSAAEGANTADRRPGR